MRTLTRENLLDILYGCAILGTGGGSLGRRLENMPARHIDVTPQGGFYTAFLTEEIHLGMQSAQRQTVEARLLLGSAPKGLA